MQYFHKRIVLAGLNAEISDSLTSLLNQLGCEVEAGFQRLDTADAVFCSDTPVVLRAVLHKVQEQRSRIPVIAVGASDAVPSWLDAVEAGADDYLCAHCERVQVGWALGSNFEFAQAAA
jgi:DNA-binding response OmpR family regulator